MLLFVGMRQLIGGNIQMMVLLTMFWDKIPLVGSRNTPAALDRPFLISLQGHLYLAIMKSWFSIMGHCSNQAQAMIMLRQILTLLPLIVAAHQARKYLLCLKAD